MHVTADDHRYVDGFIGETCAPPTSDPAQVAELVRDYGRIGQH